MTFANQNLVAMDLNGIIKIQPKPNGVGERLTELEVSRLKKEHGTLGSYDWCCENWGTKWNSVHQVETDNDDYDDESYVWFGFNTAWSAPTPIANTLKSKFRGHQVSLVLPR